MASKSSRADLFEPDQVSLSVSADEALQFLEDHGFFYQGNSAIGGIVDYYYSNHLVRNEAGDFLVEFKLFDLAIRRDPVGGLRHSSFTIANRRSVSLRSSITTPSRLSSSSRSVQL